MRSERSEKEVQQRLIENFSLLFSLLSRLVSCMRYSRSCEVNTIACMTYSSFSASLFNQVAWFVSNCHPRNQRMHYARELSKYIQVDIYGACGSLRCPRSQSQTCFDMLDEDYKFYLAFENSNCKDYITEKFFVNGLGYEQRCLLLPLSLSLSLCFSIEPRSISTQTVNASRPTKCSIISPRCRQPLPTSAISRVSRIRRLRAKFSRYLISPTRIMDRNACDSVARF